MVSICNHLGDEHKLLCFHIQWVLKLFYDYVGRSSQHKLYVLLLMITGVRRRAGATMFAVIAAADVAAVDSTSSHVP